MSADDPSAGGPSAGAGLRGARVLVTGAGGFVGRHLVARLQREGADVHPLTRAECDLADEDAVRRTVRAIRPETVLHLAATRAHGTAAERRATAAVNSLSGARVIEAVGDECRSVVVLGSSTELAASASPMDESTPLGPRGFFGRTKAAGSLLATAAAAERGIPLTILRAFQVYGPADKPHRFIPTVLDAARTRRPLELTRTGLRRDWVWVGDVVDACVRAAAADVGVAVPNGAAVELNIGSGVQTANEEVVRLAEEVTGRPIPTVPGAFPPREWDTGDWVCDPSAARRTLGWTPRTDLAAGLRLCWEAA